MIGPVFAADLAAAVAAPDDVEGAGTLAAARDRRPRRRRILDGHQRFRAGGRRGRHQRGGNADREVVDRARLHIVVAADRGAFQEVRDGDDTVGHRTAVDGIVGDGEAADPRIGQQFRLRIGPGSNPVDDGEGRRLGAGAGTLEQAEAGGEGKCDQDHAHAVRSFRRPGTGTVTGRPTASAAGPSGRPSPRGSSWRRSPSCPASLPIPSRRRPC